MMKTSTETPQPVLPSPTESGGGGTGLDEELRITRVLFKLPWRVLSIILLMMPLVSMFICLITSIFMHGDHINNTICKVYNFLPSISAVTGVSPQRYLWRVCVALHISPRLLVSWVARSHYVSLAEQVPAARRPSYLTLVSAAFYLNLTELFTLCGVTYISNKENYPTYTILEMENITNACASSSTASRLPGSITSPDCPPVLSDNIIIKAASHEDPVHEKLFTMFMLTSLVYMLCVIRVVHAVRHTLSPMHQASYFHKKFLFATKLAATFGLLFFFYRHRTLCEPMAFSWFSLCEYVLATCNMLYHVSVALDFSEEYVIVGHVVKVAPTSTVSSLSSSTTALINDTVSNPTASIKPCGQELNSPSGQQTTCDDSLSPSSKSEGGFEGELIPTTTHNKDLIQESISDASVKDENHLNLIVNVNEAEKNASAISTNSDLNCVSSEDIVSDTSKIIPQDSVTVDATEMTGVKSSNTVGVETCNIKPEPIVHQVLNTIHEDLETSQNNGPTDTVVQRRSQTQSIECNAQIAEKDAQLMAQNKHAHSE